MVGIKVDVDPGLRCPYCRKQIGSAMAIDAGGPPEAGDITICSGCGEIGKFVKIPGSDTLSLEKLSPEELIDILQEYPELNVIQRYAIQNLVNKSR